MDIEGGEEAANKVYGTPAASEEEQQHARDEDYELADASGSARSPDPSPELPAEKEENAENPLTWDMEAKHEHWKFCPPEARKQDGQRIFEKMSGLHDKLLEQRQVRHMIWTQQLRSFQREHDLAQAVSKQRNQVTTSLEGEIATRCKYHEEELTDVLMVQTS